MNYIIISALVLMGGYLLYKSRNGNTSSSSSFQNINVVEARKIMKNNNVTMLDVRTPMEVSNGKIGKAETINVASPSFRNGIQNLDKDKNYIVYCRSGRRSIKACNIMAKEGFTNLYNLEGGYNAWK